MSAKSLITRIPFSRSLHTARPALSAIKSQSDNLEPHGGAGIAGGDLKRTKAATSGDKYRHVPPGWEGITEKRKEGRFYELVAEGVERPHNGWETEPSKSSSKSKNEKA